MAEPKTRTRTVRRKLPEPEDCPRRDLHTPSPAGYLAWHEWAEEMGQTHQQIRCPDCERFEIWVPRPTADERDQGDPLVRASEVLDAVRAERDDWKAERDRYRAALKTARKDIEALAVAGFDSSRRSVAQAAAARIEAALERRKDSHG